MPLPKIGIAVWIKGGRLDGNASWSVCQILKKGIHGMDALFSTRISDEVH